MLSRRDFGKAVAAVTTSALIPANTSYAAFAQAPADPYGVLAREMASRGHRLHHYLWHQSRNNWHRFNDATRAALKKLQWAPPRPSQLADMTILTGNGSGEDFLFMHRGMVREANEILVQAGAAPNQLVNGWARLPEPSDKAFPVPAPYEHLTPAWTEIVRVIKSDEYYEKKLLFWERLYRDPDFLRSVSLAELGARMEFTIHDAMHMRWSARPAMGIRPDPTFFDRPPSADELDIDSRWDVVEYNFLGEEYSAQANPIFWKIHGWVDDRISDWMIVHGVRLGMHTGMDEPDWKYKWVGPVAPSDGTSLTSRSLHMAHAAAGPPELTRLEEAVRVLRQSGKTSNFLNRASALGIAGGSVSKEDKR